MKKTVVKLLVVILLLGGIIVTIPTIGDTPGPIGTHPNTIYIA